MWRGCHVPLAPLGVAEQSRLAIRRCGGAAMRSAWSSFQGPWTRLYVVLSLVSLALASLPVWWVLTTIVRLELPVRQVHEWEAQAACPVHAPVRIGVDLRDADWIDAAALRRRTEAKLASFARGPQLGDDFPEDQCLVFDVHTGPTAGQRHSYAAEYSVRVLSEDHCFLETPDDAHVCLDGAADHDAAATAITAQLAPFLGRRSADALEPEPSRRTSAEDSRIIQYARKVRVVFSLLNEDASAGGAAAGWDLGAALSTPDALPAQLAPLARVLQAVKDVHSVELESQVQWYAPVEFEPAHESLDGTDAYFASMDELRVFVNSAQWNLESYGVARDEAGIAERDSEQVLQFVLYLPSLAHRPLLIRDPSTDAIIRQPAWLVPQWGGVVVWNRDQARASPNGTSTSGASLGAPLSLDELAEPMHRFASQLAMLLGVDAQALEAGNERAAHLAIQGLMWRRTLESTRRAVETLASIVRLAEKITILGVGRPVRDQVELALERLQAVQKSLAGDQAGASLRDALRAASEAQVHASRAFFHPTMLAMLYFPDEHKYAVYTPLFGPLLVPLLAALVRELRYWKRVRAAKVRKQHAE